MEGHKLIKESSKKCRCECGEWLMLSILAEKDSRIREYHAEHLESYQIFKKTRKTPRSSKG